MSIPLNVTPEEALKNYLQASDSLADQQGKVANLVKVAHLPLITQRAIFGALAGQDVFVYGRIWTYIESMFSFAATAVQALAFFVKDFALSVLALIPAIFSSDARRFLSIHVNHMLKDLVAIPVGVVGFISPHVGNFLAKTAINVFISMFQDEEMIDVMHDFNNEEVPGFVTDLSKEVTSLRYQGQIDALAKEIEELEKASPQDKDAIKAKTEQKQKLETTLVKFTEECKLKKNVTEKEVELTHFRRDLKKLQKAESPDEKAIKFREGDIKVAEKEVEEAKKALTDFYSSDK